ncbi:MAG: GspH/FimT family pseudopilin [Candidatus Desulfatibia sp.]|uniref:pilus assembly FimT family protein n=1 Tax=Candidatus Desulfatibia sp. TaxID=3101189 RepID=UPI002F2FBF82
MRKQDGFTIVELIIVIAVMGIMAAIAVPNFMSYLPDARLKSAARDLYSNLRRAKIGAIKSNKKWAIVFNADAGTYEVCSGKGPDNSWRGTDNDVVKKVILSDYGSGVTFGRGSATDPIGGTFGNDFITYSSPRNVVVMNSRGTGNSGYVYLTNASNISSYGVGTRSSGVVILRRWLGADAPDPWG